MVINALNSGASVYMADFEDANTPTWRNLIEGQRNLIDAIDRTIAFRNPDGKVYKLNEKTATLVVRPRGWHLDEKHFLVEGRPDRRRALRLRPVLLPQREAASRERDGSVLLSAEAREPS